MPINTQGWRLLSLTLCFVAFLGFVRGAALSDSIEFETLRKAAVTRFGADAVASVSDWEKFIAGSGSAPVLTQLSATNDFFNGRLRWATDEEIYGVEDYWATPLETLGSGEADCEDFTIAKYITLLALGVDPKSLRLVYVKAFRPGGLNQAHMVLAWYENPTAVPLILDNINTAVLPAVNRQDLTPIFSFNADDLWISGANDPSSANPQLRISRWRQVLERIANEGFRATW
ncbi:transglutaminase-like cysteine peptidase [Congregibacter variabilis]|uniref:Transglutaminase-like cysteine peptidase n=1 Tax=Congregibacter variabilis TaxID=3081200 RepID=A0ABZ0I6X3_9GAMM|nr:transglutaminase-like cysteine peptidase [Congregibacter sp. IMCC43200]